MADELRERAAAAVELATQEGAQGVWARAMRSRSVSVSVRDGELEKVQDNVSRNLSLTLWVDGRYGSHSTTDLDATRLQSFIEEAVALTRALEPDADRQLPDPALFEGRSSTALELFDPTLEQRTLEQRVADCMAMNERARAAKQVLSATSSAHDGHGRVAMVSSNGFADVYEGTSSSISTNVTLADEGDKRPEDGLGVRARHRGDLLAASEVGSRALQRAQARLGTRKGPTLTTTMVVDPLAGGRLISMLLGPTHGHALQQGRSMWAGELGKRVAAKRLTIVDDPLRARGLASRPFDGEGIAAKAMPIIEAGKLRNFYLDTYYARKLAMAPTTGERSNLVVAPGKRDLAKLVADVGSGVYVSSWLGGNSDDTTGDFSLGMRGHLIEGGRIGAPVGEMNVTGNLVELFAHLAEVGSDPWPYSSMLVPTLVFEGVTFSGT